MSIKFLQLVLAIVICLWLTSGVSYGQADVIKEVTEAVETQWEFQRTNLAEPDNISVEGSLGFWSSGGLMHVIPPGGSGTTFESFNVFPKHITVIPLADGVAVAMYYAEGSMDPVGAPKVDVYRTRGTEVYVKEDGEWRIRAAHWSPIKGGEGISTVAVEEE